MSGSDAQILIYELLKIAVHEGFVYSGPPPFKPQEINNLFTFLKFPSVIRNDAITAVGAPSSIGFLVKAIYWLYLIAKLVTDYGKPEEDEELEDKLLQPDVEMSEGKPESADMFSELLNDVLV